MPPSGECGYPLDLLRPRIRIQPNRLTTAFPILTIIPIAILASTIEGGGFGSQAGGEGVRYAGGGLGILVIEWLLMLLFRGVPPLVV